MGEAMVALLEASSPAASGSVFGRCSRKSSGNHAKLDRVKLCFIPDAMRQFIINLATDSMKNSGTVDRIAWDNVTLDTIVVITYKGWAKSAIDLSKMREEI
jgi:hypothetical protein